MPKCLTDTAFVDFLKCPWLYYRRHHLHNTGPMDTVDAAAHSRVLYGRDVYEQEHGQRLTPEQQELVEYMAGGVAMNAAAVDRLLYGRSRQTLTAYVEYQYVSAIMDWVHPHLGITELIVVDNLDNFVPYVQQNKIVEKLVLDRFVLLFADVSLRRGLIADTVRDIGLHCVAVEKACPYRCGVWEISEETAHKVGKTVYDALRRFRDCTANGNWPTEYEHVRKL